MRVGGRWAPGEAAALGWLLLTAVTFGGAFASAKPLVGLVSPVFVCGARYVVVALILFAVLAARRERIGLGRDDLVEAAKVGAIGFGLFQGLWGVGLALTTAANAAILMATAPMFGALIAAARGERVPRLAWLGLVIAFGGIFLLVSRGPSLAALQGTHVLGDLLWLGCAALWAVFTAVSRPLVARTGPLRATAWAALLGGVPLMVGSLPWALAAGWASLPPALGLNFVYLTVAAGAVAQFGYYRGIAGVGVARAIAFLYLVPVFGVVFAVLTLGERLNAWQMLGAGCVLAGVAITQRR